VFGLVFAEDTNEGAAKRLVAGAKIVREGAEIGTLYSAGFSPTQNRFSAIAFVDREFRVPGMSLQVSIEKEDFAVTSVSLPFYGAQDKLERAQELYEAALQEFAKGSEQSAIAMLRDVIRMNPTMGDAYEVLGVILSKHDQLDDAIELTKQLAQLDPNSIMAHANLSVYYMQKGDKEAAEEEKAIAMSIRMSQIARSAASEQQEAEERKKLKAAAEDRMNMFRQVLAIDADDFLANAGLGSVYVDMEQYNEAIPYLEKALSIRPNHTVAYVALGEAFEKLNNIARAVETYKKGIAVASQRGDGEPMKKMQIRLLKLGAGAST
jgi:tetratricopeptide (TPR) repeat protein